MSYHTKNQILKFSLKTHEFNILNHVCVCVCVRERERERETYKNFDAFHFANMLLKALYKSGIAILN